MSNPNVSASFIYSGLSDYWSGDGARWDDNKGCLFASFGPATTLKELIDALADDYTSGGDCDEKPAFEEVSREDVLSALLTMLSDEGRRDYETGALCKWASQLNANDWDEDGESPQVIVMLTVEPAEEESAS